MLIIQVCDVVHVFLKKDKKKQQTSFPLKYAFQCDGDPCKMNGLQHVCGVSHYNILNRALKVLLKVTA